MITIDIHDDKEREKEEFSPEKNGKPNDIISHYKGRVFIIQQKNKGKNKISLIHEQPTLLKIQRNHSKETISIKVLTKENVILKFN